ncbi:Oxysterol-binding protein-like protein [Zancudomyces culisetae]|uniref:Oxysterol-binding protein-like protein n=1 Tax=Zancudomyces culisetae TaxID=1213189 RepID=A0A1R1PXD8_ZANCU|nr:Oxysterol-binding protein-like protein [Zancudomyces culisetae]OMH85614.1 Oxysterol-binding protein-like protein [Zancudomyces culisetae]|eukprot:OMH83318.1 Oxysterol-binding protein-like protein [Zancudomyces culisetae]
MTKAAHRFDNRDNEEELGEESRSIIVSILTQVGTSMDLSKVTLPTFVLEPRSFTERITDFMSHPDVMLAANRTEDPVQRFLIAVKSYMSGWHIHPRGVKKPYNPVLGEFFRGSYEVEKDTKAYFISEQVSHHPPMTAFYYTCPQEGIHIHGDLRPKSRFYGNSVGVVLNGLTKVYLEKWDERYELSYPNMYARGIFFGKMILEIGGKSYFKCEKSDLIFEVDFKVKGLLGGKHNKIAGKIKRISTNKVLYEVTGDWQHVMHYTPVEGKQKAAPEVLFDSKAEHRTPLIVNPIEMQEENESRRKWDQVSIAIKNDDLTSATREKSKIEDKQRHEVKIAKEKGIKFKPKFFCLGKDGRFGPLFDMYK